MVAASVMTFGVVTGGSVASLKGFIAWTFISFTHIINVSVFVIVILLLVQSGQLHKLTI